MFLFKGDGEHLVLHFRTPAFPTRRASDRAATSVALAVAPIRRGGRSALRTLRVRGAERKSPRLRRAEFGLSRFGSPRLVVTRRAGIAATQLLLNAVPE